MTAMASTTIVFGVLLTLLGVVGYALTRTSMTALIPSLFGLLLLILGFLARSESIRKHAMHAAATVALVGCVGALIPLLRASGGIRPTIAVFSQVAMVVLTAAFIALCVRSFIAARRARGSA
jgi:uncharacterized membrane protein